MILGHGPARLDPLGARARAEAVDAGAEPVARRSPLLGVVANQRGGQRPVRVAGGDRLEQVLVAVSGGHHAHRDRHTGQVRRGYLVVQEVCYVRRLDIIVAGRLRLLRFVLSNLIGVRDGQSFLYSAGLWAVSAVSGGVLVVASVAVLFAFGSEGQGWAVRPAQRLA